MSKKNYNEKDFLEYIDSEIIAFYCNDLIVREKNNNEYVDTISNSFCSHYVDDLKLRVPVFYKAKLILERDYNVDIYKLPFKDNTLKTRIRRYELMENIKEYLIENEIYCNKNEIYDKAKDLSKTSDYIKKIIDEITDIDIKLINYNNKNFKI